MRDDTTAQKEPEGGHAGPLMREGASGEAGLVLAHASELAELSPLQIVERRMATAGSFQEQREQLYIYRELHALARQNRWEWFHIGMSIGTTGLGAAFLLLGVALPPFGVLAAPGSFLLGAGVFGFVPRFVRTWFGGHWRESA